jgi:DNA-binding SARP family transcriptional activator
MALQQTNPARLYLPLLTDYQPAVRRQACLILLGTYGDRALSYLRRLVDDPDPQVRYDARLALLAIAEITDTTLKAKPFRGVHIECLGPMRVYIGNYEMRDSDWTQAEGGRAGARKMRGVLAYLVHCGRRGSSREALGAALWEKGFSASSLSRTLSALRQTLRRHADSSFAVDDALVIENDYCLLDSDCYSTDTMLFEQAYSQATRVEQEQNLEAAIPLYTNALHSYFGPYMADIPCANGWSRSRRNYLRGSFVIAAERLAEYAYSGAQYSQCLDMCALALDAEPTADEVVCWQLRAYAECGLYADLEHAYRGYLHAAGVDALSQAGQQDAVVQLYQSLGRSRARGAGG